MRLAAAALCRYSVKRPFRPQGARAVITIEVRDDFISAAVFGEFTLEDF